MGEKKIPLNESYSNLRKSYDNLNNQQSSSEHAPRLYQNTNQSGNNSQGNSFKKNELKSYWIIWWRKKIIRIWTRNWINLYKLFWY